MARGISLGGAPVGRWRLEHGGRLLEVETGRAGWDRFARLYVDGVREAAVDGVLLKAELPYGQWSVAVVFDAAGLLDGQAARCALTPPKPAEDDTTGKGVEDGKGGEDDAVGGEPVAFEPPAGTRAARREAFARTRPVLYASRHVVVAAGKVLFPLLGLGALVRLLLALVPRPDVDLPDIDLPSPPWPDIPLPDLPDLPEVPGWVRAVLAATKFWVPVLIAAVVAVREVRRRGRSAAEQGEQPGAGERDHDGGDRELPARGRAGAAQGEVVRGDGPGDVAEDDGVDLDLRGERGPGEVVVDPVAGGAEQVPARPERVAGEDDGGLPFQDEEGEVVGEGVAERDGQQRRGEPGGQRGRVLAGQAGAEAQRRDVEGGDGADRRGEP